MLCGAHSARLDPVRLAASEQAESPLRGLALGLSFPGCKPGADQRVSGSSCCVSAEPLAASTPQNPRTQPPGRGLTGLSAPPVLSPAAETKEGQAGPGGDGSKVVRAARDRIDKLEW